MRFQAQATLSPVERARRYLAKVPPAVAGQRGHDQTFRAACVLIRQFALSEADALALLREWNQACQPPWTEGHLAHKVRSAARGGDFKPGSIQALPRWPAVNEEQRAAIIHDGGGQVDLWEASPVRVDWNGGRTDEIIDGLFPEGSLICAGVTSFRFDTRARHQWRPGELGRRQFIVPSPMLALSGLTADGQESKHCLANTGPRRFLVVEFDTGTTDEHAAIIAHLAGFGPLALAVHSGSKSLHGWFYCAGLCEDKLHRFMRYAVSLGADPATWTRSQFVRMPDATRDNGKRQAVIFFNPEVIQP